MKDNEGDSVKGVDDDGSGDDGGVVVVVVMMMVLDRIMMVGRMGDGSSNYDDRNNSN